MANIIFTGESSIGDGEVVGTVHNGFFYLNRIIENLLVQSDDSQPLIVQLFFFYETPENKT